MSNLIIYILLFSIYTNILFYGNHNGLNWVLDCIPLLILSILVLVKNNKMKHKSGLLFSIPIILLSISNVFYNSIFTKLNIIVIPILFIFMYIYTIRPTFRLDELALDTIRLIFNKFNPTYIGNYKNIVKEKINDTIKLKKEAKKKLTSILIVTPIVLMILGLLIAADMQFKNLFSFLFNIFDDFNGMKFIIRIVLIIVEFFLLGSFLNYLLFKYEKEEYPKESTYTIDPYTIKLLLIILNIIYIVFDIIQIRSLFLHHVGDGIVYSEYARRGFFQLMFVSVLNIGILLISKKSKENKMTNHLSSLMVLLTFIIICSSFYRMYLYDIAYGYTVLRLLVYASLITEAILLIPTVFYIYDSKVKILKYYMIICLSVYTILNAYSIDKIIAKNNINRYDRTEKIDIDYLVYLSMDDLPELYEFYKNVEDYKVKEEIKTQVCNKYLHNEIFSMDQVRQDKNIFEYNYGRAKGFGVLDQFECD